MENGLAGDGDCPQSVSDTNGSNQSEKRPSTRQYGFSENFRGAMYDRIGRERKAKTMIAVLTDFFQCSMRHFKALDIGCSTGIISHYLSKHFSRVVGIDIDKPAVEFAARTFKKDNLDFLLGDSMHLSLPDEKFDVAICAHVYEHVTISNRLMQEIHRVLKPNGVCYFSAGNRIRLFEPHYNLPLLSLIPRFLAHPYLRWSGKGSFYFEKHLTYRGLIKLTREFHRIDYTRRIIADPDAFFAGYMIGNSTLKGRMASLIANHAYWLLPSYIWILKKKQP